MSDARRAWTGFATTAAGGTPRKLLADAGVGTPQFSPDGKSLLFIRNNPNGPSQLFNSSPVGDEPKLLPEVKLPVRVNNLYSFSPDGKKLALNTFTQELWIAPFPRGEARRIQGAKGNAFDISKYALLPISNNQPISNTIDNVFAVCPAV